MSWQPMASASGGMLGEYLGQQIWPKMPGLNDKQASEYGGQVGSMLGQMGVNALFSAFGDSPGTKAGKAANDYFSQVAPGAGQWDRLRASNPGGQMAAVNQQTQVQERMQQRELETRKDVARIGAAATLGAAATPYGGTNAPIENQQRQIAQQIKESKARVQLLREQKRTERVRELLKKELVKIENLGVTYAELGKLAKNVASSANEMFFSGVSSPSSTAENVAEKLKSMYTSNAQKWKAHWKSEAAIQKNRGSRHKKR